MTTRSGQLSKPDAKGHYTRQLGWKTNEKGQRVQHKFRLGSDKREAELREALLRKVWETIASSPYGSVALWNEATLEIASQVSKGVSPIKIRPLAPGETDISYADRLQRLQNQFPFLRFEASDIDRYTAGIGLRAYHLREIVVMDDPVKRYWDRYSQEQLLVAPPLRPQTNECTLVCNSDISLPWLNSTKLEETKQTNSMLHQAFEAYRQWIRNHYFNEATQDISDYAYTKLGQVDSLQARHEDISLSELDSDHIEAMFRY